MGNKLVGLILVTICLSSCVGTKSLYKGLTKKPSTINYLYDTELSTAKKTDTISVLEPIISDETFTKSGNLRKTQSSAIPLIIYTGWKNEHEYFIGEHMVEEDLPNFIQKSIIEETNRSTTLFADSSASSDLVLEITVDSIGAHGPYRSDGFFVYLLIAYAYSSNESAGPGIAYSKLNYVLKNNEDIVLSGNSSNQFETEPLLDHFKNPKELRSFFNANLAEGISRTLKANIEQISKEVEHYIATNE